MGVAQSIAGITSSNTSFSVAPSYPMRGKLCYPCESGRIAATLKKGGISGLYMNIVRLVGVHDNLTFSDHPDFGQGRFLFAVHRCLDASCES